MASPFDSWLKNQGVAETVATEPGSFDEWLSADKGRAAPAIQEPAEPTSFDGWLKQGNRVDSLTAGEKVKEYGKSFLRMPEYVAANVGDVIGWFAERGEKGILPKWHTLSQIQIQTKKLVDAILPQKWEDMNEANQQKLIKFGKNVSEYWREAAATGIEAKDPRIEELSWLEAPFLKGLTSGIESSGSFLVSVAAGIITKNPTVGLVILGTMSGGGTYAELKEEGVGDELANATALLVGTFEGLSESIPFNALFNSGSKTFLRKFLKTASTEALQELFQNMGENYLKHFATEYTETGEVSEALKISWAQLMENWQEAISGGLVMGGAGAMMTGRAGLEPTEPGPGEASPMPEMAPEVIEQEFNEWLMAVSGGSEKDARILRGKATLVEAETEDQQAATQYAARFGKQVVWFSDPTQITGVYGSVHLEKAGVVFMAAQDEKPVVTVMTHELVHHMERDAPEVYKKLRESIEKYTMDKAAYLKGKGLLSFRSPEIQNAEFVADIVSQVGLQPDFWNNIAREEPGVLEKIIAAIRKVINQALGRQAGDVKFQTEEWAFQHIQDFVQIQKAAEEAFRAWAPAARKGAQLRKLRQQARRKAEAGEEISPEEIKLLQMKPRHIREMVAGEIQESQRESVNRRVRKIAGEVEGPYADHAWTFLSRLAYERQLPDNTIAAYLTSVREFSRYMKDSGRGIQAVRPEDLRAFKRVMSKAGKSASTINLRMAGLNEFFGFLAMSDQIAGNPMLALADELVKGEQKLPKVLSVKQMGAFVRAAREGTRKSLLERNIAMSEVLWATGARASEITDIKVSDLRLGERLMVLHGKGDKDRLVPITHASAKAIQAHIDKAGLKRHEYLFQTRSGDQMTRQDIGRFVKQYAKKAGLPSWVSTHTMRHTFATHLMEGGADIRFIQEMMGHSTPEITALYAHVTIQRKKETFKKYHPSEVGVLKRKQKVQLAERRTRRAYKVGKFIQTPEGKLKRQPTVRQAAQKQVARETGMEVETRRVLTEEESLKATMKAQRRAASQGFKAGLSQGKAKAQELKNRYKTLAEWRKAFKKFVKKTLPANVQGTMLSALEGIKGERSYEKALTQLIAKIEQVQRRQALTSLKKTVQKIRKKWGRKGTFGGYKLMPQYEKILDDLMAWFTLKKAPSAEQEASLNELLQWAIQEQEVQEAKGQTDTPFHNFGVVAAVRKLTKEQGRISVADWPAEKIDQITEALQLIVYQHLYEREAFNRIMRERLEADIVQGTADVAAAAGKRVVPAAEVGATIEGVAAKLGAGARALLGRHNYNLSTLSRVMSGMKKAGPTWRRLAGNIERGLGTSLLHRQRTQDMLLDFLKNKGVTARDIMTMSKVVSRAKWRGPKWVQKLADLDWDLESKTFKSVPVQFIDVVLESGKNLHVSVGEALDIYMHTRNPDNYKALTGANGISFYGKPVQEGSVLTDADVDVITEALFKAAPKAAAVVEAMEQALAFQQNEINKTSRRLIGYDIATLPGYWHIRRLIKGTAKGKKAAYTYETIEGRSHLKERVGGKQPLVIGDAFNNMIETIGVGADYVGMAEPLRNAKTMLADKDFIRAAEQNGFAQYLKDINHQIGRIENPGTDRIWHDKMIALWSRNVTRAIFAHNMKIAAQQEISVFLAFAHIPFKYATALRPGITADVVRRIEAWSPYIRDRFGGHISREIGDIAETGGALRFWTGKDQYANWGTYLIRHFDKRAIVNVWRMVEAEVADRAEFGHLSRAQVRQNGAYQAAVATRAEQILRDTQPTWHKVDRSIIGSDPSTAARMMTMFHSQREKMVQMAGQANAVYRNSAKAGADKRRLAQTYGMIGLNLAMVNVWKVVFGVVVMGKRDEPEELVTNMLADIPGMFYILGPPIRETVKAVSRTARGKRVYQLGGPSLPPLKVLESGKSAAFAWGRVATELIEGHNAQKELIRAVDETWDFSQYAFGLPFKSVTDIAKAWSD